MNYKNESGTGNRATPAAEAFEYLLGHPKIDSSIRDVLWHNRSTGFEAALSTLQELSPRDNRLERMLSALADMYSDMENAFEGIRFNFENEHKEYSLVDFLWKFDAIFTLNQDLLLERFYVSDVLPKPLPPASAFTTWKQKMAASKRSSVMPWCI